MKVRRRLWSKLMSSCCHHTSCSTEARKKCQDTYRQHKNRVLDQEKHRMPGTVQTRTALKQTSPQEEQQLHPPAVLFSAPNYGSATKTHLNVNIRFENVLFSPLESVCGDILHVWRAERRWLLTFWDVSWCGFFIVVLGVSCLSLHTYFETRTDLKQGNIIFTVGSQCCPVLNQQYGVLLLAEQLHIRFIRLWGSGSKSSFTLACINESEILGAEPRASSDTLPQTRSQLQM